jgi:hypothetical protein
MKNLYYDLPYELRLLIDKERKYLFKKRINDMNNKFPKGFFAWGNLNGKHRTCQDGYFYTNNFYQYHYNIQTKNIRLYINYTNSWIIYEINEKYQVKIKSSYSMFIEKCKR